MEKTILVLGAGASKSFCNIFPTGLELIKEINYHLTLDEKAEDDQNPDRFISSLVNATIKIFPQGKEIIKKIRRQLWDEQLHREWHYLRRTEPKGKKNPYLTIDSFIAEKIRKRELPTLAKEILQFSIFYLIKGYEQAYAERDKNLDLQNWVEILANRMIANGLGFKEILANLKIINFNYDRTFDKYFIEYLKRLNLQITDGQILEFERSVFHVYGKLGTLERVPFHLKNEDTQVIAGSYKEILLMSDRPKTTIQLGLEGMFDAKRIIFLGFGYDKINLDLLGLDNFINASKFGTGLGLSKTEIAGLEGMRSIRILREKGCKEVVEEFFGLLSPA